MVEEEAGDGSLVLWVGVCEARGWEGRWAADAALLLVTRVGARLW